MSLNGYSSQISPKQSSENSLSFSIDYSATNGFLSIATNPLNKPYLTVFGVNPPGNYELDLLNLTSANVSKVFNNSRSMAFVFRPFYSGGDYLTDTNASKERYDFTPSVIVFNNRTGQAVHIKMNRFEMPSVTLTGTTTSYVARAYTIQGVVPFYFDLEDTVEVCCINPASANFGKLSLSFFNFDMPTFYTTNFDSLVPVS